MDEHAWYLRRGGEVHGPIPTDQVKTWPSIRAEDVLISPDGNEWRRPDEWPELEDGPAIREDEKFGLGTEEKLRRFMRIGVTVAAIAMVLSALAPTPGRRGDWDHRALGALWPWDRVADAGRTLFYVLADVLLPIAAALIALLLVRGRVGSGRAAVLVALSGLLFLIRVPDVVGHWLWVLMGGLDESERMWGGLSGSPSIRLICLVCVAAGARALHDHPRSRAARWLAALAGGVLVFDVLTPQATGGFSVWHLINVSDRVDSVHWGKFTVHVIITGMYLLIGVLGLCTVRRVQLKWMLRGVRALTTGLIVALPLAWGWWYYSLFNRGGMFSVAATKQDVLLVSAGHAFWFWGMVLLAMTGLMGLIGFEALRGASRRFGGVFE